MTRAFSPVSHQALLQAFNTLLEPHRFKDYGPNGLQVEGKSEVRKIVSGVTASVALIEAAIAAQADAVFVHHGLFWHKQNPCVVGWLQKRLRLLLTHNINLYAYHLPLDAHPTLGNNAQLAQRLDFTLEHCFGDQDLGCIGHSSHAFESNESLKKALQTALGRSVLVVGGDSKPIRRIAWCTGGAQSYFEAAVAEGADAFITGELSEPQTHLAREMGVAYFACGHHATERFGAPAVAAHVAEQCGLAHEFMDIDNPA